jgi:hypothetical protein
LLDPLAWTVIDDEAFADVTDSFDADEDPIEPGDVLIAAGVSTQMDRTDEIGIGGALDSRSATGSRGYFAVLAPPGPDEAQSLLDSFTIGLPNDSIAAGTTPWRSFAKGGNLHEASGADDHSQIAELSPLDHSAPLALAATLWITPSAVRAGPEPVARNSGATARRLDTVEASPAWKVYVMGLDQALEQSYREVRRGLSAEAGSMIERSRFEAAGGLEWRGPIVPAASPRAIESSSEASRTGSGAPSASRAGSSSFLPAVLELGEFLFENLLNPVLGHEHGGHGNSQ